MGQIRTLPSWCMLAPLMIGLTVAACEGQPPDPGAASSETEPLGSAPPGGEPPSPGPPPPPAGAFLAQLPPEQTSQLTNLGVAVVVPGVVPPTFSVVEIRTDQAADSAAPGAGVSYLVVYQSTDNRCFAVEFAADGIGDPPATESRLPMQPPLFKDQDYGLNYGPFAEPQMREQMPGSNLYSDWLIGPSGAYRLVGAAYIGSLFQDLSGCADVAPQEAVSIVESFTVLAPAVIGDGDAAKEGPTF